MPTLTCEITGKTVDVKETAKGNPKLPMGWKWRGDKAYSKEAWHDLYCLRAITVPIVSPVVEGANPQPVQLAWGVLDEQLKDAWQKSTEAANWAAKRLWSNDVTRQQGQAKCPPMPKIYLYGERDWTGWSQSAGAVLRTVEGAYRHKRYDIVHLGSSGVPNVRYPYPFPIHNASWGLEQTKGGEIHFDCRLPAGRVTVKLRTDGKSGKYRVDALRHLIANPDLRGEAALIKKRDGTVMVKLVGWFPKVVRQAEGELKVRTDANSFLVILNEKDERLLILNGDWIRRKYVAHLNGLQRWREDLKFEVRNPRRRTRKRKEDVDKYVQKMHSRLKSFIDETCAQVVGHAVRRKIAAISYDDTERSYFRDFAWHRLKERLRAVCDRERIYFVERSSAEQKTGIARERVKQVEKA